MRTWSQREHILAREQGRKQIVFSRGSKHIQQVNSVIETLYSDSSESDSSSSAFTLRLATESRVVWRAVMKSIGVYVPFARFSLQISLNSSFLIWSFF